MQTYYISLIILIPFSIDLISNVGITVLQAKNKLKYRSIPMIIGSVIGFILAFPFTDRFGIYGCAWAISISIFLSNALASNIVFYRIGKIDVLRYWKEIATMLWLPIVAIVICCYLKSYVDISTVQSLCVSIVVFSIIYIPLNIIGNMNMQERKYIFLLVGHIK